MLSAMVRNNPRYRIRFPLHQLYRERHGEMTRLFPRLDDPGQRPAAYWLEVADGR